MRTVGLNRNTIKTKWGKQKLVIAAVKANSDALASVSIFFWSLRGIQMLTLPDAASPTRR